MSLFRGCVSVWLLTPLRVSKRDPPLKRTYELFRSLLTTMDCGGKNGKSAERSSPTPLTIGWSEYHEGPNCTLEMFRNWGRNGSDPMAWLSQFLKEFDTGSKERTAVELKTLARCLWLSNVYDQLNGPNLCCLEEITRRVCQLVEAHESGAHGKPNWSSVKWFASVQSSSNMVPVSMGSFAFRKAKEEVETENLRLRATKTVLVFEDGEGKDRGS